MQNATHYGYVLLCLRFWLDLLACIVLPEAGEGHFVSGTSRGPVNHHDTMVFHPSLAINVTIFISYQLQDKQILSALKGSDLQ